MCVCVEGGCVACVRACVCVCGWGGGVASARVSAGMDE